MALSHSPQAHPQPRPQPAGNRPEDLINCVRAWANVNYFSPEEIKLAQQLHQMVRERDARGNTTAIDKAMRAWWDKAIADGTHTLQEIIETLDVDVRGHAASGGSHSTSHHGQHGHTPTGGHHPPAHSNHQPHPNHSSSHAPAHDHASNHSHGPNSHGEAHHDYEGAQQIQAALNLYDQRSGYGFMLRKMLGLPINIPESTNNLAAAPTPAANNPNPAPAAAPHAPAPAAAAHGHH